VADSNLAARERDDSGDTGDNQKPHSKRRSNADGSASASDSPSLSTASAAPAGTNSGNMVRVRICMESMELATKYCPDSRSLEFMSGTQPRRFCSLHGPVQARHRAHRRRRHPATPDNPDAGTAPGETAAASGGSSPLAGPDSAPPAPTATAQ
jgi:hypothetical protein